MVMVYVALARAAVTAVDAHVSGKDRQHGDGARRQLAVRLALRSPALADVGRFRGADFRASLMMRSAECR